MESLYLLVPLALVFLVIAIKVLFWAVNSGQYDDLKTEGYRILFDDDAPGKKSGAKPVDSTSSTGSESPPEIADKDPGK